MHTVLGIGANVGSSARVYCQVFPKATIYSFEPLPSAFSQLEEWARGQNGSVIAVNAALGDREGEATFKQHVDFSPSSSFLERTAHSTTFFPQAARQMDVQVKMFRLDDVAQGLKIVPGILIKMDVQGFEDRVIEGGRAVFGMAAACIMEVSIQHLYKGQPTFKKLNDLMYEMGFQYAGNIAQVYDEHGRVIYLDVLYKKPGL